MLFQLVIIQVIIFFAIVFVLRKLLYTETAKETKRLKVLKEENTRNQKELQQKIEAAENVYREKVAQAEEDIRKFRIKAEEEIGEIRQKMIDKAKDESERILKAAFNTKEKLREEIILQTEKNVPVLASRIFKEVLSPGVKEIIHKELVKKVIDEVKKLEKSKFKIKIKTGELISAYPLGKNERNELLSLISGKLGYGITFDEKEEKKLVAGIVVRLGTLVIEGTLSDRLRQICAP